jgi:hypothetical protein
MCSNHQSRACHHACRPATRPGEPRSLKRLTRADRWDSEFEHVCRDMLCSRTSQRIRATCLHVYGGMQRQCSGEVGGHAGPMAVGGQWETHCAAGGGTVRPHDTAGASIPTMANAHRIRTRLRGAIADQKSIKIFEFAPCAAVLADDDCIANACSGRNEWRKHEWDVFCDFYGNFLIF